MLLFSGFRKNTSDFWLNTIEHQQFAAETKQQNFE